MTNVFIENILREVLTSLLFQHETYTVQFSTLLEGLPGFEQRNVLYSVLKVASKEYLPNLVTSEANPQWWYSDAEIVSAVAGLISTVLSGEESRKNQLIAWLTSSSGAGIGDGVAIRRAAIAALSGDKNDLETVLDKSLQQFGDQLYIRHTPTLQQEGMVVNFSSTTRQC